MHSPFLVSDKDVRHGQLKSLASAGCDDYRLMQPALNDNDVIIRGDYRRDRLRPGLIVHATDMCQLYDLRTSAIQQPGMTFALFLKGEAKTWIGDRPFTMGSTHEQQQTDLEAVAIARVRPDSFVRYSARGCHIRKVTISISPQWLEDSGLDGVSEHTAVLKFSREHLASVRWRPSQRLVALTQQLLTPPDLLPMMQNLYCESRAIEFIAEAFQAIARSTSQSAVQSLRPNDYRRMKSVCEFLEAHLDQPLTLHDIARNAGLCVNTLQRLFRTVHGTTVFEYTRALKLQRARQALETEGVSVTQAAFIAGYSSAANFATAFKRQFGVSPKNVRSPA